MQPVIEETAVKLAATDPVLMSAFLTNYSVSTGDGVFHRWQQLAAEILTKHVDGYVKNPKGRPKASATRKNGFAKSSSAVPSSSSCPRLANPSRPIVDVERFVSPTGRLFSANFPRPSAT